MCSNITEDLFSGWKLDEDSFNGFEFEKIYLTFIMYYVHKYWYLGYLIGVMYIAVIFGIQRWMRERNAYELKLPLFLWNTGFAIFSIFGLLRTAPDLMKVVGQENGLFKSICVRGDINPAQLFWGLLFGLSKTVELGDTLFIVLRKRPLVALQWYHHLVTMLMAATVGTYLEPILRWGFVLNYGVHSIMYSYFAAKTIGIHVPAFVAKTLTTFQFIQMLIILVLNLATFYYKLTGQECARETTSIVAYCIMFGSFSIIFGQLFYKSVVSGKLKYKRV